MEKKWNYLKKQKDFHSIKMLYRMKAGWCMCMLISFFSIGGLSAQEREVSIDVANASLEKVFLELGKQTGYEFLFNYDLVASKGSVTLEVRKKPLKKVLNMILPGMGLSFSFEENTIVISEVKQKLQRNYFVRGVVVDNKEQPLPGVTVMIEGTQVGTATDKDGKFELVLSQSLRKGYLLFSFVGFRSKRVVYEVEKTVHVIMEEDISELDQVVVTGYQTMKRRDMVGSYSVVKMDDLMVPGYTSVQQMLQGRVPGLVVMNTSSRIGTTPKIRIRGTSTFIGNQDPLFVVDGIIQPDPISIDVNQALTDDLANILGNQISWLNPNDIESITVLKDASATAIYGAKAANGVIVITTKKTKEGQTNVNYSVNCTFRRRPYYKDFNLMNSQERVRLSREAFSVNSRYNDYPYEDYNTYEGLVTLFLNRKITESEFLESSSDLETINTDWFDLLTQNSFSHNHNLSISGSGNRLRYNASFSYGKNKGIEIGNHQEQKSGHLSLTAELTSTTGINASLNYSDNTVYSFAAGVNPIAYATSTSRAIRAYNKNGDYAYYKLKNNYRRKITGINEYLNYNIINERENSYSKNHSQSTNFTLNFFWNILPELRYEFVGGYISQTSLAESYAGEKTYYIANKYRGYDYGTAEPNSKLFKYADLRFGGEYTHSDDRNTSYNIQNKLLWSKTFKEDHRLNAMVAFEVRSTSTHRLANTVWGYTPDRGDGLSMPTTQADLAENGLRFMDEWGILTPLYNGGAWQKRKNTENFVSYMATLAYSLKGRYVFNANMRSDASNRFGEYSNHRFNPTYSFGFSWQMEQEPFIQSLGDWLETASLRVTYGIQGNVVTSVSPEMIAEKGDIRKPYEQYYSKIIKLPNENLDWESTKSWNIGFDFSMFKGITVSVDYYRKKTNAMVAQRLTSEYGVESMENTGGELLNSGIEYSINVTPFRGKDFAWTIGLNSGKNWNEGKNAEISIPQLSDYYNGRTDAVLKDGYDVSSFWSYSYAGLDPEYGFPTFNLLDVELPLYGDPTQFMVYSGKSEPDFNGGLTTSLRYKNFSLGASFAFQIGSHKRLKSPFEEINFRLPSGYDNASKDLLKRWQKPGDEKYTDIPAFDNNQIPEGKRPSGELPGQWYESLYRMWDMSDLRVVDASFFRCNNLSLSWQANSKVLSRLRLKNLSVNLSVSNIFVIASDKFQGFDPELGNSVNPQTYSFGINVGF